jgi:hypothetical protein
MQNLEPASPMKPSEKAVTMVMPKRKLFVPKNKAATQENSSQKSAFHSPEMRSQKT